MSKLDWGEVEVMDICGYDACRILEEIANMYALSETLDKDYVSKRTKEIFIREKILRERDNH